MANEKNGQVYQIGNQAYYIEVCFFNGIYETPVNLNMGIIEEINIKESLNQLQFRRNPKFHLPHFHRPNFSPWPHHRTLSLL